MIPISEIKELRVKEFDEDATITLIVIGGLLVALMIYMGSQMSGSMGSGGF